MAKKKSLKKLSGGSGEKLIKVIKSLLSHGVDGLGPMSSSQELANEYLYDERYDTATERVKALTSWETKRSFGAGFITSVGGLVTLPVTVPAGVYASFFLQARLAGAIACLHGHSVEEERVRTTILLCLLGNAGKELIKEAGVSVANKVALNLVEKIPGKVLIEINKKVGFRLFTKAGEKGVVNFTKVVPLFGGLVGGTIDAKACKAVARIADRAFAKPTCKHETKKA